MYSPFGFKQLKNKRSYATDIDAYNKEYPSIREEISKVEIPEQVKTSIAKIRSAIKRNPGDTELVSRCVYHELHDCPQILLYPYSIVEYPYQDNTANLVNVQEPFLGLASYAAMYQWKNVLDVSLEYEQVCMQQDAVRKATVGMFIAMFYGQERISDDVGGTKVSPQNADRRFLQLMQKFCEHKQAKLLQDRYGNNIGHYVACEYPLIEVLVLLATDSKLAEQKNDIGETFIDTLKRVNPSTYNSIHKRFWRYYFSDELGLTSKQLKTAVKVLDIDMEAVKEAHESYLKKFRNPENKQKQEQILEGLVSEHE